ncbi:hypothetical protein ABL78_6965 [Leptomonas seymouri]|uniref:PH domain-containing protein n=1 Tax=Leptomonas seymouri TaxID=5684 RepID=A0A0N1HUM2_LEPSE|nr:hypothetical protein ABL78_6965 [Leptomonas seymouri]|eukprot:KPI83990.1 hypothetical protein ABL78_6965 [Leptomonas seymouri]
MALSAETIRLQDEWSTALQHTVHDLVKMTNQAARSHEAYLNAMTRVGQLYAECGDLMASANTSALSIARPVAEVACARGVAAHLMSSIEHWRRSDDERKLTSFLSAHTNEWRYLRQETARISQHHSTRSDVQQLVEQMRSKLEVERMKQGASSRLRRLETELDNLQEELAKCNERVQRSMAKNVKLCCKELITCGSQLVDVMSASGYSMECCFQSTCATDAEHSHPTWTPLNLQSCDCPSAEASVLIGQALNESPMVSSGRSNDTATQEVTCKCTK